MAQGIFVLVKCLIIIVACVDIIVGRVEKLLHLDLQLQQYHSLQTGLGPARLVI